MAALIFPHPNPLPEEEGTRDVLSMMERVRECGFPKEGKGNCDNVGSDSHLHSIYPWSQVGLHEGVQLAGGQGAQRMAMFLEKVMDYASVKMMAFVQLDHPSFVLRAGVVILMEKSVEIKLRRKFPVGLLESLPVASQV